MTTHRSRSAIHIGEQHYLYLFEHAPICILVVDLTADPPSTLQVNRRAALVYGYTTAELTGMPAIHLVPKEAVPTLLAIIGQVQHGQRVTAETVSRHRDGTHFPVRVIATPDPTDAGRMIMTVEDITTEKQRRTEADAIEAERHRIAREIHDGVAQSLAGLRFKSALWSHQAETAPTQMSAALDELQAVLNTALADLRRAIFALRPINLDALGFFPALTQLVCDIGDQNQIVAQLETFGPHEALPAAYELPLFRIIQEGLNNVGQHAGASALVVRLTVDGSGGTVVSVRDNGRGFEPSQLGPADHAGHFGLRQMRERILDLGGTLDIRSAPGQGTELRITLPPVIPEVNHVAD